MCNKIDFLKLEYGNLRKEIEISSNELREIEKYTIIIVSALWGWFATHIDFLKANSLSIVWWLPVIVVFLGILRFLGVRQSIFRIAKYIASEIEPNFIGKGWEHWLSSQSTRVKIGWWLSVYVSWAALFIASLIIGYKMA